MKYVSGLINLIISLIISIAREIQVLNLSILKDLSQLKKMQLFFGRVMLLYVYQKKN